MNKLFFLFLAFLVVPFISATSIGEFQLDVDDVEIYQTCNNCTYCNFSRVMSPTNQTLLSNLEGLEDGTYYYYNLLKTNFTDKGTHTYCYDCGNAAEKATGCLDFEITYTGGELTSEMSTIYIISIVLLMFFFVLLMLLIRKLPSGDRVDEDGRILQVSQLKHLRIVVWGFAWAILLAILFIVSNMAIAYLPNSMIGELFFVIYQIAFWISIIAIPLWFILIFTNIWRDKEVKKMLERGVDMRSNL